MQKASPGGSQKRSWGKGFKGGSSSQEEFQQRKGKVGSLRRGEVGGELRELGIHQRERMRTLFGQKELGIGGTRPLQLVLVEGKKVGGINALSQNRLGLTTGTNKREMYSV